MSADTQELLNQARNAWQAREHAEAQIARLDSYATLTMAMKADRQRWLLLSEEATAILRSVLGWRR